MTAERESLLARVCGFLGHWLTNVEDGHARCLICRIHLYCQHYVPIAPPDEFENEWFEGVKGRVLNAGDGYVNIPRSDWECIVDCWTMGEGRLRRYAEALELIASMPTSERNSDGEEQAAHSMQAIAQEALGG